MEALYNPEIDAIRDPEINKGLDPKAISFAFKYENLSPKLKGFKLKPYGIQDQLCEEERKARSLFENYHLSNKANNNQNQEKQVGHANFSSITPVPEMEVFVDLKQEEPIKFKKIAVLGQIAMKMKRKRANLSCNKDKNLMNM